MAKIKTSDLIQNTGEIKQLKEELMQLRTEISRLIQIRDQLIKQQAKEVQAAKSLKQQMSS